MEYYSSGELFKPYSAKELAGDGNMGEVRKGNFNQFYEYFFRRFLLTDQPNELIRTYRNEITKDLEGHSPVSDAKDFLDDEEKKAVIAGLDKLALLFDELPDDKKEMHYKKAQKIVRSYLDLEPGDDSLALRRYALDNTVRAIKVLKYTDEEKIKQRFEREIKIMRTLDHPNIVKIIEGYVKEDQTPYAVMEFVETIKLEESELEIHEAVYVSRQALEGLIYLHEKDILHADVKPHNILVTPDKKTVKLTDFGISKYMHSDRAQKITGTFEVTCTPFFMDPDRAIGDNATPKSDLYSLGATLFHMLTGCHHTGEGENPFQTMIFVTQDDKKSWLREHDKGKRISYALEDVVMMTLSMRPENRLTTHEAAFLLDELIEKEALLFEGEHTDSKPKKTSIFGGDKLTRARHYEKLGNWYPRDIQGLKKRRDAFAKSASFYEAAKEKGLIPQEEESSIDMKISILKKRIALEEQRQYRLNLLGVQSL